MAVERSGGREADDAAPHDHDVEPLGHRTPCGRPESRAPPVRVEASSV